MGNRETIGIVTILAGILLVVGSIRGTWQKIFSDVILAAPPAKPSTSGRTSQSSTNPPSGSTIPTNPLPSTPGSGFVIPQG